MNVFGVNYLLTVTVFFIYRLVLELREQFIETNTIEEITRQPPSSSSSQWSATDKDAVAALPAHLYCCVHWIVLVLLLLTALIFFHCRSSSAFSLVSLKRRVFLPSDILMPYWKAALRRQPPVRTTQTPPDPTACQPQLRDSLTLAEPLCCSCNQSTPPEYQSPSGPEDLSCSPKINRERRSGPLQLRKQLHAGRCSYLVHLAVIHFFITVNGEIIHPATQPSSLFMSMQLWVCQVVRL